MIYISPRVCLSALGQYITLSAKGVFLDFHSIKIWIYSSTCPAVKHIYTHLWASQVVLVVKNLSVDAGNIRDTGLFNPWVKKIGEGNDYPVQYSWLENSRERGARWAIVHRVAQSWTKLSTYARVYKCVQLYVLRLIEMMLFHVWLSDKFDTDLF